MRKPDAGLRSFVVGVACLLAVTMPVAALPSPKEAKVSKPAAVAEDLAVQLQTPEKRSEPPGQRGARLAKADIAKGTMQILYYGKPWSLGKPLVDDESSLPVKIIAGCRVSTYFANEVDAYNRVMREAAKAKRDAGALVGVVKPNFADAAPGDAQPTPQKTEQDERITIEIARLASSNDTERAAAVKAIVEIGKPATPALVTALSDPRKEVRAAAAEALRSILAADPASAPNRHEKTYWERRVAQLKPGMALEEALKLLLPGLSSDQRKRSLAMGFWGGGGGTENYRLDDYWMIATYLVDFDHKKLHDAPPVLVQSVRSVWVAPPAGYTGVWVTWHVNGQKAHEIEYRNGQREGTSTGFDQDGSRRVQQHYAAGVCHGTDTGWHKNGKKSYEGQHQDGKQEGTWRWWNETGQLQSIHEYRAGELIQRREVSD